MNRVSIGSDSGLSLIFFNGALWTNFSEILIKNTFFFIHENASENIFCEMAAILYQGKITKFIPLFWRINDGNTLFSRFWRVFHYTWRVLQLSFRQIVNSRIVCWWFQIYNMFSSIRCFLTQTMLQLKYVVCIRQNDTPFKAFLPTQVLFQT